MPFSQHNPAGSQNSRYNTASCLPEKEREKEKNCTDNIFTQQLSTRYITCQVPDECQTYNVHPRYECTRDAETLARYGAVDIALDPFPYSGGLTTCEALWMGVPVITFAGETFAGRHALSHLATIGLTETIARDPEDYVQRAVSLSSDVPRLSSLRAGLRQRMAGSPLCDTTRFAGDLLTQLRGVWRQWCHDRSSE